MQASLFVLWIISCSFIFVYGQLGFVPVIDIGPALSESPTFADVAVAIGESCRNQGFFYVKNHQIPQELISSLLVSAEQFFSFPVVDKKKISMTLGGKAWRGYFSVGEEFTSGVVDQKEGIYFGTELLEDVDQYLHGRNLFPQLKTTTETMEFRNNVLSYMNHAKNLGKVIMQAIALSLNLTESDFGDQFSKGQTELFRIFNYPPNTDMYGNSSYAVGEHTDYGFITILYQDSSGGLQVKKSTLSDDNTLRSEWMDVPPIEGTLVINLGDALERMTGGLFKATPHRVLPRKGATANRLSLPYFFDPHFDSTMTEVTHLLSADDKERAARNRLLTGDRWDKNDPSMFQGTYGNYLLRKVSKVFPELASMVDLPSLSHVQTEAHIQAQTQANAHATEL